MFKAWNKPRDEEQMTQQGPTLIGSQGHQSTLNSTLPEMGNNVKMWKKQVIRASQVVPVVKKPPTKAGDVRDVGLIAGLGRSPGGGNGNPLQYSCQENPIDRGAWQCRVHGVIKSQTQLSMCMHVALTVCPAPLHITHSVLKTSPSYGWGKYIIPITFLRKMRQRMQMCCPKTQKD